MDQAEQLRNLVKQKSQKTTPNTARVVTITSGKGGVGKSNVAVNLAVQLRKMGKRVIIFDADLGLANIEVMFDAVPKYNLGDLIYGGKRIQEIIVEGPMEIGFISGGSGISSLNNLSKDQIIYLVHSLAELNELADVIIIDTGAGISDTVMEFVLASPEVILVTTPDPSSITDSYSLLKALYRNPAFSKDEVEINIVSNKVNSVEEGQSLYEKLSTVVERFLDGTVNYIGMIPQDEELDQAVRQQKVVSLVEPNANSSMAFQVLASNYMNHECKTIQIHRGITQIFVNLITRKSS